MVPDFSLDIGVNSMTRTWIFPLFFLLFPFSGGASIAFPHEIHLSAHGESATQIAGRVDAHGSSLDGATVEVRDDDGKTVTEVSLDEQGQFEAGVPEAGVYHLTAVLPDGHLSTIEVSTQEFSEATGSSHEHADRETEEHAHSHPHPHAHEPPHVENDGTDEVTLENLQVQLRELRNELEKGQARRRWQDMIGAVGYLFGLAGLWMMFRAGGRK
jgi:hypothetical protein